MVHLNASFVILVEEYFRLGNYGREDDVFRKSVSLSCTEHTCVDESEVSVSAALVYDVDHLGFSSQRHAFMLGNDEDRTLYFKTTVELIADDCPVLGMNSCDLLKAFCLCST